MQIKFKLSALLFTAICFMGVKAQISGTVYRDYNNNGTRETSNPIEPLANGIIVNAYNASDVLVATTTTAGTAAPNYTLAVAAGAYRLEFIVPGSFVNTGSGAAGTGSGTSVRFVTAPAASQGFGIFNRREYFENNPNVVVPQYQHGTAAGTNTSLVIFPYANSNDPDGNINGTFTSSTPPYNTRPNPTSIARINEVGSVYGLAWKSATRQLFLGTYLRRKAAFGPNGPGAIYGYTNPVDLVSTPRPSLYVDLNTVFSGNPAGTITRPGNGNWDDDATVNGLVGKLGIGDIELNNNQDTLYAINLGDRQLYAIPTVGTLNNATIRRYDFLSSVSSLSGVTGFSNANIRPFGLGVNPRTNFIYIGAVYSAEGDANDNNLRLLVWQYNSANAQFTLLLNEAANYRTGTNNFQRWQTVPGVLTNTTQAMPMLSDIVFDGDVMVLGIRDRYGDVSPGTGQVGNNSPFPRGNGDVLRVHFNGTAWVLENDANSVDGNTGAAVLSNNNNSFQGPGGDEFYYEDLAGDGSPESFQGALLIIPGKGAVMSTAYDAVTKNSSGAFINQNFNTSGVSVHSNSTGQYTGAYDVIEGDDNTQFGLFAFKANGLGDIEALTSDPSLEIGNRVWNDANGNGIQDANETGIANVTIQLYSNGADGIPGNADDVLVGTTTTDGTGNYLFTTANVADGNPTVAGNQAGPQPNFNYNIRISNTDWAGGVGTADLAGLQLTKTDKLGNGAPNLSDNDAALNASTVPMITVTTGAAGQNNHTLDFGFKALASIGDKVWRDDDKDGIQDTGEPGLAGVTVTLYNNAGAVVATTVTDAYGNYLFDNLTPGDYSVGFTPPANYTFTTSAGTSEADAANSDANAATGRTTTVTLSAGENQRNIDAGLIFSQPSTNSIGDRVWYDIDNDGVQDANEAGVSGVTVTLYDNSGNAFATTVTDANGNYIFTNLPDGNYRVGFTLPSGMLFTTKGADNTSGGASDSDTDSDVNTSGINFGKTDLINLDAAGTNPNGVNYTDVDAGLILQPAAKASVGDRVWNDLDNDGIQDAGEPGVAGVPVTLYAFDGTTIVATTVTDAFGNYIFNNLDAGAYIIGFGTAPGFTRSANQNTGTNDLVDNDASPTTGQTAAFSLVAGQRNLSVDAALISSSPNTARLGDYVWFDADKDGVQDAGEQPVAGVTVTLYNGAGAAIGTTVTDAKGFYQFTNLAAGTYSVGFSNLPAGYSFTTSTGTTSASNTTNSDANPATGRTAPIALTAGESLQGLDAGLVAGVASGLGSLGNKVWWDLDGDNIQDADEPGVPGVTVTLLDYGPDGAVGGGDDGPSRTATTNALGEYLFTGLPAGNYAVQFGTGNTLPVGATAVTQNSGANDAVDSDGAPISGGTSTTAVYALGTGEDNLTVDLGLRNTAKGSFGNRVWYDNGTGGGTANDGIQNGGEIGVGGVMVTLVNAAGQPVDRTGNVTATPIVTTTDANGYYAFADLTAGVAFAARFSNLPAGFDFTTKAGTGSGDDSRSDADVANGLTPTVTIVANTFNATLDAGITNSRAALGNFVWLDDDGDCVQDAGEPGVPGVTVTLYRPGFGLDGIAGNADDALPVTSMITDQNGQYLFNNLLPGTYEVEFSTLPSGLTFTQQITPGDNGNNTNSDANPATGRTTGITLTAGEVDLTVDAGLFKPRAVIGNYVWVDQNGNGVQDGTEPPAPGVLVTLLDGGGNAVAVAITDANGNYLFPNVAPGTYSLSFGNLPQGSLFTTPNLGGNDNTDSDVIGTTITGITVTTTTNNISFDAGLVNFAVLPVRLIWFNATAQGNTVLMSWEVTAELNLADYVVEHSIDGLNFSSIGNIAATGSSKYSLNHGVPVNGLNYYRLKMRDRDGSAAYSAVRVVNLGKGTTVKLYPNPVSDVLFVTLSGSFTGKPASISVTAMDGRRMLQQSLLVAGQTEQLDVRALPAGKYVLQVATAAETVTQTFVVTR